MTATEPTTRPATTDPTGDQPAVGTGTLMQGWQLQARAAYERDLALHYDRQLEAIAGDIELLRAKLTELGITPVLPEDADPYLLEGDGIVTTLIADSGWDEALDRPTRAVLACCRDGHLTLRATDPDNEITTPRPAGPLNSLADVGRALIEGPEASTPRQPGHYQQAEHAARHHDYAEVSTDTHAICRALTSLTHAVLALADRTRPGT
ncbi:hypothetical protein [Actinomadura rupiterrae]|uniref:hypothetical protein n=1 Tax=Actinomadura rupiterrae TaxID=559627 RepID=UPI0020A49CCC|nr:hypothetical protein [Actinomadura rupiterrae]MCP2337879.1 hypothetical protein [Actinomadura rupiterrae]